VFTPVRRNHALLLLHLEIILIATPQRLQTQGFFVMTRIRQWVFLALCCVIVLTACSPDLDTNQAGPTAPPSVADAEQVASNFLDGWVKNDYSAMYALISGKAQATSKADFSAIYKDVEQKLRITERGKSFTLLKDKTIRQGSTVVVHYDMTFDSGPLGKFTDSDRIMRLMLAGGKWHVAWTTMDIFDGLAAGTNLDVEITQATRGTIYDRNGKVIAQDDIPNYAVRLIPGKYPTGNSDECFQKLAFVFNLRTDDLRKDYGSYTEAQYGNYGFTIGTLSEGDYNTYRPELDTVCKIEYRPQVTRFYYGGSFAAQTVGFLGTIPKEQLGNYPQYNESTLIGRAGVESYWQKQLAGESGARLVIRGPDGTRIRSITSKDPGDAQDVKLAMDREVQLAAERAVAGAFDYANWAQYSTGAAAVVLDANTGAVLAIASYPTIQPDAFLISTTSFDADVLDKYNRQAAYTNRAVNALYAPGSVFKIVTSAAGVGSGAVKMSEVYVCRGYWDGSSIGDKKRLDWIATDKYADPKYHDAISFQQALTSSCDAYYWELGSRLFKNSLSDKLREYANNMGLGVKTGIDVLSNEPAGLIPDPDWKAKKDGIPWGLGDTLNIVIGQGDVTVTPLQVARMMVAVANGGDLYVPHIVESVGIEGQTPSYTAPTIPPTHLNLSDEAIKGIEIGLCDVTTDEKLGTAQYVFYNWDFTQVSVCGKTGTAQTGTPYPNGWFAAYAGKPGQKPDIAVVALVESSREGSETAGPIVRRIIEAYYGLPQEPWPFFWTGPYDPLTDPDNVSDGGGPRR
jgi:penicillin-binding protein 2